MVKFIKFIINLSNFIDEDEIYNNPNFHSKDQDELEIPEDIIVIYKLIWSYIHQNTKNK